MILVSAMIFLLMSTLFLVNFLLRERVRRDKTVLLKKREAINDVSILRLYEKTQGKDDLIEYFLGIERIWMEKNEKSPGGYRIERIIRNNQVIYTQENNEIPGDIIRKYLTTLTNSSYKLGVIKIIKVENSKEFTIRADIQVDFLKGNLNQSKPDLETFLGMTVKEQ